MTTSSNSGEPQRHRLRRAAGIAIRVVLLAVLAALTIVAMTYVAYHGKGPNVGSVPGVRVECECSTTR
jgi:hypothetical protein